MASGKAGLALELLIRQAKRIHAKIGEALEEDGAGQAGEMRGSTGGKAVEFVELHGGEEQNAADAIFEIAVDTSARCS